MECFRFRRRMLTVVASLVLGCTGAVTGTPGAVDHRDAAPGAPGDGTGDEADATVPPFQAVSAPSYVRKVKAVLTGLAPDDEELASATDEAGLRAAIDTWMATPQFRARMQFFFANAFQQSGFAIADFEFQLKNRPGAFDLPYGIYGDEAFPTLQQNLRESFARTAWQIVADGRPFTEVLTTQDFMMTTALKSLYLQVEMPRDRLAFFVDEGNPSIPISESLDPASPRYLHFSDAAPTTTFNDRFASGSCRGQARTLAFSSNTLLFQVLLGVIPRSTTGGATCMEHASRPYFTPADLSDWKLTRVRARRAGEKPMLAYDLPAVRAAQELPLALPRVGFFTTPAFLAVWNTNDSNQHRVTANQALLVALGQGFSSVNVNVPTPVNSDGLDPAHSVAGSDCFGCHKSLDPMRTFFTAAFDDDDRPRATPSTAASGFAFGDVNTSGHGLVDFGTLLGQVSDASDGGAPISRFALEMTQKLCFFANSAGCAEDDPEFRRVARVFQEAHYDFKTLVRTLMSSPLVTAAAFTPTFADHEVVVSIARRDQLCGALSERLGIADVCALAVPTPVGVQARLVDIAGAVAADAFSRGAEVPVTPSEPNLFYRAASEMLCEAIAVQVVDAGRPGGYDSADAPAAIARMVTGVLGYPPTDPHHAQALEILTAHHAAALDTGHASATDALRSTFALACQSPTSLSFGL